MGIISVVREIRSSKWNQKTQTRKNSQSVDRYKNGYLMKDFCYKLVIYLKSLSSLNRLQLTSSPGERKDLE